MESGNADGGMPQLRRGSSARRLPHSGSSGGGGGGGPAITELEALIRFVELMGRSAARPDVPECRAALLAAAGWLFQKYTSLNASPEQKFKLASCVVVETSAGRPLRIKADARCCSPAPSHHRTGLHWTLTPRRLRFTGLHTPGTDPAAALAPGTLPEALPGARASVLLQNLRIAPSYVVVSGTE